MPSLELKPTLKPVQTCCAALRQFDELGIRIAAAAIADFTPKQQCITPPS
jgi:hypothetical protein